MQYQRARAYALSRLQQELPANLFYHGLHHTLDVCRAAEELAAGEALSPEELLLVQTAAIYHDVGFIEQYLNNEPIAAQIARETLPAFGYSAQQISIICNIILATRVPQQPQNLLEQIVCDADLDYLGREDFFEISETLRREWLAFGLISSTEDWNCTQIRFFQNHHYFTRTAREKREARKQQHLTDIQQLHL